MMMISRIVILAIVNYSINHNVSGICVVALSRNLKLTTALDRAITQNPCYVPLKFKTDEKI
jgi:hypothetical protein